MDDTSTQVPNVTEGAVSGLDHDSLEARPKSTLRGSKTAMPADGGAAPLSKQAQMTDQSGDADGAADTADANAGGDDLSGNVDTTYSPADHTVDEVNDYLANVPDSERARIIELERSADEPRVTINGVRQD